jgi:hypothetical protein
MIFVREGLGKKHQLNCGPRELAGYVVGDAVTGGGALPLSPSPVTSGTCLRVGISLIKVLEVPRREPVAPGLTGPLNPFGIHFMFEPRPAP